MARKQIKWYNIPGTSTKVRLDRGEYTNGNLGIILVTKEGEDYCDLTVNLGSPFQSKSKAFLDINNFRDAEEFVTANGLGVFTGIMGASGFCTYPLYDFSIKP